MLLNIYEGRRLMGYLRKHHPAKWAELTTFLGLGPGWVNGFRSVPWLYSADTLGDPGVAQLKSDYRQFICLALLERFIHIPHFRHHRIQHMTSATNQSPGLRSFCVVTACIAPVGLSPYS